MGSLQQTPLPLLLLGLHQDGFTGPLTLRRGSVSKRVAWQGGAPVGVESSAPGEDLVSVLVAEGAIAADHAHEVFECMTAQGLDALRAVLSLKKAAPKDVVSGLAAQIQCALVGCFAWDDGEFEMAFEPEAKGAPALPIDLVAVVHAGIAAHWPLERVLTSLGERATAMPAPGESFDATRERLPSSPALDALVASLDGSRPSFELLQENPDAAAWAALWVLDASGALEWGAATLDDETPAAETAAEQQIEIVVSGAGSETAEAEPVTPASEAGRGELDDRAVALQGEVLALHARLGEITHYELLGLEQGDNPAQVKRAYLKAAKRMHPDRLSNLGLEEIKDEANEVFARITRAHKILSSADERGSYDASLEGHTTIDAERVAQAEVFFRKGETLLRAGNFLDAVEFLDSAVQVWPDEADYQAALAWALHRKNPPENERSLSHFERAIELGGENAETLLRMSYPAKEMGDPARADALATKARRLDPDVKP